MGQPFQHPSKLVSTKLRILMRRREVLRLTKLGLSLRKVARAVGVSHETVRKDMDWWVRELCLEENEQYRRDRARRAWFAWFAEHGHQPMPADPATVATYLAERTTQGAAASTVRRIRAAIRDAHRDAGQADPTAHESVRRVLRAAKPAPLGADEIAALIATTARIVMAELVASGD